MYRYAVSGSDKASIDTGVDTPQAGTNVWSNGDVLEVWMYLRTDEAIVTSLVDITLNNDTSNVYVRETLNGANASAVAGYVAARANWQLGALGASGTANYFSGHQLVIPNYNGTVGFKNARATADKAEASGANSEAGVHALQYLSASAITRLKIIPDTAAKNFKVGSELLIFKRLAA